jgi:hypothetical protein
MRSTSCVEDELRSKATLRCWNRNGKPRTDVLYGKSEQKQYQFERKLNQKDGIMTEGLNDSGEVIGGIPNCHEGRHPNGQKVILDFCECKRPTQQSLDQRGLRYRGPVQ